VNTLPSIYSLRQGVDEITVARQAWDMETRFISRRSTFASGRRIKTEWTPQVIRRNTEVHVDTAEELSQYIPSSAQEEDKNKYSQKPSVSSLCAAAVGDANPPPLLGSTLAIID
jgi:hypothetical protein